MSMEHTKRKHVSTQDFKQDKRDKETKKVKTTKKDQETKQTLCTKKAKENQKVPTSKETQEIPRTKKAKENQKVPAAKETKKTRNDKVNPPLSPDFQCDHVVYADRHRPRRIPRNQFNQTQGSGTR